MKKKAVCFKLAAVYKALTQRSQNQEPEKRNKKQRFNDVIHTNIGKNNNYILKCKQIPSLELYSLILLLSIFPRILTV